MDPRKIRTQNKPNIQSILDQYDPVQQNYIDKYPVKSMSPLKNPIRKYETNQHQSSYEKPRKQFYDDYNRGKVQKSV